MQINQAQRAGSTVFTNYELGITVKVGYQDFKLCGRTGLNGIKGQLSHMARLGGVHGPGSRSICILEWLEADLPLSLGAFEAKLWDNTILHNWLDDWSTKGILQVPEPFCPCTGLKGHCQGLLG